MADLNIGDLDYGISAKGVKDYIEKINYIVLTSVRDIIDEEQKNVMTALDKGWAGEARQKFDQLFNKQCLDLKSALFYEYKDLESRLNELANDFVNQDRNMMLD